MSVSWHLLRAKCRAARFFFVRSQSPAMASSANDIQQQWKKENKKVQPVLQQLQQKLDQQQSSAPTERTLAVNQLDAQILDKELFDILRAQFLRIFSFFKVRRGTTLHKAESVLLSIF
jgi:uncharacterized membrane protein